MMYEVVPTFESVDEIRWCDHLNDTSLEVLLRCTICFCEIYRKKFGILSILDFGLFCEWKS